MNPKIDTFIEKVYSKVSDSRYYYSQNRENKFAVDCSWLLITSLQEIGIDTKGATYTGDMVSCLRKTGLFDILQFNTTTMKRGDILLRHVTQSNAHTVLYIGNNTILEACNTRYGLRKTNYYPNNYQYIIRFKDNDIFANIPTLRKGSEGLFVCLLQLFLNKYEGCRLKTDGEFGSKTYEAVFNFQIHHANDDNNPTTEIDGIVGIQTWTKIYFIMVQD